MGRKFCWISCRDPELLLDALAGARLGLLAADELGDPQRGRRLRSERVEELAVVGGVVLAREARAEVEHPDELALADERERRARRPLREARSSAGESMSRPASATGPFALWKNATIGSFGAISNCSSSGNAPASDGPDPFWPAASSVRPRRRTMRVRRGLMTVFYNTAVPKTLRDRSRVESRCVYDPHRGRPQLSLALLGPPVIEVDGRPLDVDTRKATALLAYLAIEGRALRRDSLASLLWPENDPERARSALRRTLSTLRTALGGRWLAPTASSSHCAATASGSTAAELRRLVASARRTATGGRDLREVLEPLRAAAALDRGPFLAGFGLRDSTDFDDWQQLTGDVLAARARGGARPAGRRARRNRRHAPRSRTRSGGWRSTRCTSRRTARLIASYAAAGDRAAALEQYRECVRVLDRELGVRPLDETTALYHAVLEGTRARAGGAAPAAPEPERTSPLVGRDRELGALREAYAAVGTDGRRGARSSARRGSARRGCARGARRVCRGRGASRSRALLPGGGRARLRRRQRAAARARSRRAGRPTATPWWGEEVRGCCPSSARRRRARSTARRPRCASSRPCARCSSAAPPGRAVVLRRRRALGRRGVAAAPALPGAGAWPGGRCSSSSAWQPEAISRSTLARAARGRAAQSRAACGLVARAARPPTTWPSSPRRRPGTGRARARASTARAAGFRSSSSSTSTRSAATATGADVAAAGRRPRAARGAPGALGELAAQVAGAGGRARPRVRPDTLRDASGRSDEEVVAAVEELQRARPAGARRTARSSSATSRSAGSSTRR